ncbi:MAG: Acylphosphatase [bacterium ADurb.Bin243]|nr:MAG: Acylphosphatase [bacterium ADurb.Bin243]HOD40146.1 acylphosphatase [Candidatus Wallbacteria bacterium]
MPVSHMFISGRVQGVGFRYFVARLASKYSVCGFVRNLANGDVEVYAEGEEKELDEFRSKVKTGPSHALVVRVAENGVPIMSSNFKSFDILEDE